VRVRVVVRGFGAAERKQLHLAHDKDAVSQLPSNDGLSSQVAHAVLGVLIVLVF
jgi:hypothetical protein